MRILFICIIVFVAIFQMNAQKGHIGDNKIYFGAAYYPEAWDIDEMDSDIERMKELNMNVMRMAEFSWAKMEPEEGLFEFKWLVDIIKKLHANGIHVILGTPTATPPAWMGHKYPEIFIVNDDGTRRQHGARRNCSYTSAIYRDKCRLICEKMAEVCGDLPGVIGWQTDNEFHLSPDYSEETASRWHQWLKERYKEIDSLNVLWCTQLWSQKYNGFEQVPMPKSFIWHHPSLRLNWLRFTNDMIVEFQDIQLRAIRKYSNLPVTHDGMPGQKTDYEKLFKDLDYMAVNNYHSFEAYNRIQSNYDRMRGYRKGYHWLFETAPNNSGGGREGKTWFIHQPDGSMRAALWMHFGLGGQGAMYWLWRQHWAGHEMPHGSIISAWGKPAANYDEIKQLGKELNEMSDYLMNTPVVTARAAMFWSHENNAGLRIEQYANDIKYYNDWTYRFYRPVSDAFIHRDVINPGQDIDQYRILFAPLMPVIPDKLRAKLKHWVAEGGILLLGPMSGYRTEEWTSFKEHAYGDFAEWSGIEVLSRIPVGTTRRPAEIPVLLNFKQGIYDKQVEAWLWSEALSTEDGSVLALYEHGMHDGKPAIIENNYGKGKIVVLGCDPGYEAYKKLAEKYATEAQIEFMAQGDRDVVVAPRGKDKINGYIIVNLANEEKNINIQVEGYKELLKNQQIISNSLNLKPYDVKIISKTER